ncbi:MAG TPA: tetratricopeptide repeat-containing protein, partial [Bacteroidetes bacterium]|nr:tetratricopeptide repeat-containing protein [Bacteroidota bacterium]
MSKKSAKQPEPKKSAPKKNFKLDNAPWYLKNSGAFFLIALVSFLLYFNTLSFEYAQDDSIVINDNMFTQQGAKGIKD